MFGFSGGEILLIALIALILFGNENLPQNIKKFLKGWNQTKKVAIDLQQSWHEIKIDIQNNVDAYDQKQGANPVTAPTQVIIQPRQDIVSQEDLDEYQNNLSTDLQQMDCENEFNNTNNKGKNVEIDSALIASKIHGDNRGEDISIK